MYHSLDDIYRSMRLEPFQSYFGDYLSAIREARDKGASHDYLRQVFIEFARKSFRVDPVDIELEKGIKGTKLRGSIDALYQDIVFEFKRDLKLEREKGKEELERYLRSLGDKQVFFGVLTDGLTFEAYLLHNDALINIDEVNLERLSTEDAFIWFDAFLFSEKELTWLSGLVIPVLSSIPLSIASAGCLSQLRMTLRAKLNFVSGISF